MRITSKGQVTIPRELRQRAGLTPGTDVEFLWEDGAVRLVKVEKGKSATTRGERLIELSKGVADFGMTADEVIALFRGPRADEDMPSSL